MNPCKTNGTQPIPQTGEMQLWTTIHRILGGTNISRRSTNGQYQSEESTQLEATNKCHGSLKIPRFHWLLPILYLRLFKNCTYTTPTHTSNDHLALGRRRTNSIWDTSPSNDRQTSYTTTWLYQTILLTYRCFSLWHGSHTLTRGRILDNKPQPKTKTSPRCILLSYIHANGTQLWHLRMRTASNHQSDITLVTIPDLDQRTIHYPHGSCKSATLEITKEIKPSNSTMALSPALRQSEGLALM